MKNLVFCGVDVDDKAFHFTLAFPLTGEFREFVCKPSGSVLIRKISDILGSEVTAKICYEAGYLGFSLCRQLRSAGLDCEIIAPSLIPQQPGKKQKTDRLDSRKLADYYMKGLLTVIHIPTAEQEADRDLLRSRKFLVEKQTALKNHINLLCRRTGRDYRTESDTKTTWNRLHIAWLGRLVKEFEQPSQKINLHFLLRQYTQLNENISVYDLEIDRLSESPEYRKQVTALICFRGLDKASALTLILELGDIKRFRHPKSVTSYAGLDIIEYSSGGKERKYSISKNGNRHIRRTVIEACQFAIKPPKVTKKLRARRSGATDQSIQIADKCMTRLHKKGTRLLFGGKPRNKIKVACAREMLCFVWEVLRAVA